MSIHDMGTVIKTDLLIIGGGFAGLYAAIKARQNGVRNVIIADKGSVPLTSTSHLSSAWTVFLHPQDDLQEWVKTFFQAEGGLCDQNKVEAYLRESPDILREIESLGVRYERIRGGDEYLRIPSRGLAPTVKMTTTPHYHGLTGGPAVATALRKEALRLGAQIYNKMFITDLIVEDHIVRGAVGCNRRTGEFFIFKTPTVLIATATCSFLGHHECEEQITGDGMAIAYNAGADLTNMEFLACNVRPPNFNFEGTGTAGQLGGQFLNAKDENFMPHYHPDGNKAEVCYIAQAMAEEVRKGNGPPFYLDFRPTPPETEERFLGMGGVMIPLITKMKALGYDLFHSKVPWTVAVSRLRGGLKTGVDCMTNIQGLYAAGNANAIGPGIFNGTSSGESFWSGAATGRHAAQYIAGIEDHKLDLDDVRRLKNRLYNRPIDPDQGEKPIDEINTAMQRVMFDYRTCLIKSEASLTKALRGIAAIVANDLPKVKIPNLHEFIKFKEAENMLLTANLFLTASILRKESRMDHKREDYPETNSGWLKWIILNKDLKEGYRFEALFWKAFRYKPGDLK